jgi:hypothetical protein
MKTSYSSDLMAMIGALPCAVIFCIRRLVVVVSFQVYLHVAVIL